MFEGPATRDDMSNLNRLMYASRPSMRRKSGAYTLVREHFNPREMHLNILKLMLNQALRDNEDSGH